MLSGPQRQMVFAALCMGFVAFVAFLGAYAGNNHSYWPPQTDVKMGQPNQSQCAQPKQESEKKPSDPDGISSVSNATPSADAQTKRQECSDSANRDPTKDNYLGLTTTDFIGVIQSVLFLLQLFVFGYQALKLRRTVIDMGEQSTDMKASVAQAARAADAMEGVAASLKINADKIVESVESQRQFGELQLRAHVCATNGIATFQDQNNNFAAGPIFVNTGHTSARQFRFRTRAAVLPVESIATHKFTLPPRIKASSILPPHQPRDAYTVAPERVEDSAVETTKRGRGQALYVWGVATYEDVFGKTKRLTFLQQITWILHEGGKESVRVNHINRHNQAN